MHLYTPYIVQHHSNDLRGVRPRELLCIFMFSTMFHAQKYLLIVFKWVTTCCNKYNSYQYPKAFWSVRLREVLIYTHIYLYILNVKSISLLWLFNLQYVTTCTATIANQFIQIVSAQERFSFFSIYPTVLYSIEVFPNYSAKSLTIKPFSQHKKVRLNLRNLYSPSPSREFFCSPLTLFALQTNWATHVLG